MDEEVKAELAALEASRANRGARDLARLWADNQPAPEPEEPAALAAAMPLADSVGAPAVAAGAVEATEVAEVAAGGYAEAATGCALSPSRLPPFRAPGRAQLQANAGCSLAAPQVRRGAPLAPFPTLAAGTLGAASGAFMGACSAFRTAPSSSSS